MHRTHLVTDQADLHVVAAGVLSDALHPVHDVVQRLRVGNVVHQNDTVRAPVVRPGDLVEPLLVRAG